MFVVSLDMFRQIYDNLDVFDGDEFLTLLGSEYIQQSSSPEAVRERIAHILEVFREKEARNNLDELLLEILEISRHYHLQDIDEPLIAMMESSHAKALARGDIQKILHDLEHENTVHQYTSRMLVSALSNDRLKEFLKPGCKEVGNLINRLFVITTGDSDDAYSEIEAAELCFQFSVRLGFDEESILRPFFHRAGFKKSSHTIKNLASLVNESPNYKFFREED